MPLKALTYLFEEGIFSRAAALTDPQVMPPEERKILIKTFSNIAQGLGRELEEEIDAHDTTISRLKASQDENFSREDDILLPRLTES